MAVASFTHPIPTLEGAIRTYELFFFLLRKREEAAVRLGGKRQHINRGAIANSDSLREFLLKVHSTNPSAEAKRRDFTALLPGFDFENAYPKLKGISNVPVWLTSWTKHSRRVYSLSPEVQAVLEHTSLKEITWADIKFPFPSYAMQLATPIFDDRVGKSDFVVISEINTGDFPINNDGKYLSVIAFNVDTKKAAGVTRVLREKLSTLPSNPRDIRARGKEIQRMISRIANFDSLSMTIEPSHHNTLLSQTPITMRQGTSLDALREKQLLSFRDQLFRIVVGFTQYLKSLPPKDNYVSTPYEKPVGTQWTDSPVSPVQVCNVTSYIKLSENQKLAYGLTGTGQERAAFERNFSCVEAYWRRPRGQGTNPDAERSVWVRSYFSRKDKAPQNEGLLPGAIKKV